MDLKLHIATLFKKIKLFEVAGRKKLPHLRQDVLEFMIMIIFYVFSPRVVKDEAAPHRKGEKNEGKNPLN